MQVHSLQGKFTLGAAAKHTLTEVVADFKELAIPSLLESVIVYLSKSVGLYLQQ